MELDYVDWNKLMNVNDVCNVMYTNIVCNMAKWWMLMETLLLEKVNMVTTRVTQ